MRKTLYLHIGHFKTGTTAVQAFLNDNPRLLKRHDFALAQTRLQYSKHSDLAYSLYKAAGVKSFLHGYKKPETPQQVWAALFDELRASNRSRMIVSSEEFMRLACFPKAVKTLSRIIKSARDIDFKVIAFLRPPDSHLQSWYNQLIKMGVETPPYNVAMTDLVEPIHYDYALALRPWIEIFGAEAVTLRSYSEASRENNLLFKDFLSAIGITLPKFGLVLAKADPNPRLDDTVLEMVRILQNAGIPNKMVQPLAARFVTHMASEEAGDPAGADDAFAALRQRTLDGLKELQRVAPEFDATLAPFHQHLPKEETQTAREGWLVAGYLLGELHALRKKTQQQNQMMTKRLDALEARLPTDDGDPS
ncbi:hypothetical protein [Pseudophaeobacter flagellatus]|uniref:hypothetical protein n=1 Tax=Pseudophaeobacter flagellatus TaxID=2899119 RepID=UPI001E604F75|nr:hypothetical protein [Pseudophaeobacter flagellatus]MCD9147957.1 hypothetical protein [Pseudophaeobacter flagellatus]